MQACDVRFLGLVPYQQAWDLQAHLADQIAIRALPPTLLLLEHPHTITFGRRGNAAHLLWNEDQLKQKGVEVFWVDRGGDVTYHGPGQLVGYPILPLGTITSVPSQEPGTSLLPQADYIAYLRKLEQVLIDALNLFGVTAGRLKNLTGVWVNGSKIAAIGVKVDARGISRHGFALNVSPDMAYWDSIIGCGLSGYSTTSLERLLPAPPAIQQVAEAVVTSFERSFDVQCRWIS
jgi:lipoate-protein ligase B